jgi:opacity protein-like surface antigen
MKNIFTGAILIISSAFIVSSPVFSADTILRGLLEPLSNSSSSQDETHSWTGFYAGVNAGMGTGTSTATEKPILYPNTMFCAPAGTPDVPDGMYYCNVNGAPNYINTPTTSYNMTGDKFAAKSKGLVAGVSAGYNYQMGNVVVGAEIDFGYMKLRGKSGPSFFSKDDTSLHTNASDYTMARGRVGYAFNRLLIFTTAGVVIGRFNSYVEDPDISIGALSNPTSSQLGWVVGAGAEYAITNNISVKAEGLMMNFGETESKSAINVTCLDTCPPTWKTFRIGWPSGGYVVWGVKHSVSLLRLGVNYKF